MIVVGIVFIVFSCSYVGNTWANTFTRRKILFSDLLLLINSFKNNLQYSKLTLNKFLLNEKTYLHNDCNNIIDQFIANKMPIKCSLIKENQCEIINKMFRIIGTTDAVSQLDAINSFEQFIQQMYNNSIAEEKSTAGLIRKLSFLCGVAISVLLL